MAHKGEKGNTVTEREKLDIREIQTDVKWIRCTLEEDKGRISKLEKICYIGLGVCLAGEVFIGWIK